MTPLEQATTEELLEELGGRFETMAFVGVRPSTEAPNGATQTFRVGATPYVMGLVKSYYNFLEAIDMQGWHEGPAEDLEEAE